MSALEIALDYIHRGWAVVPVPFKSKRPIGDAWQTLRITEADARQWFNGEAQNVGVRLGELSGGLADTDLDTAEANSAAGYFLQPTLCFGRASKPRSHWLYQSDLWQTEDKAAIQFKFATGRGKDRKEQMILELRIGGGDKAAQTVFPGSVHETGELVTWDDAREAPAKAEGDSLKQRCARVAAAALLAGHFPSKGARHDAGLTLGGFLFRCGVNRPDAELFAEAVTIASGQPMEKVKDVRKAVREAWDEGKRDGGRARGFPVLAETFGDDVAKHVAKWLGYEGARSTGHDAAADALRAAEGVSLHDFRAFMEMHTYIFTPSGAMWPASSVNSRIPPVPIFKKDGEPLLDKDGNQKKIQAAAWLDKHCPVETMTWAPGEPMLIPDRLISDGGLISRKGVTCFNLYRSPLIIPCNGDARRWLEHVDKVFPGDAEHIVKWLAHRVQHPEQKINHALILGGNQGVGKDTLLEPVKRAIGPWNFLEVSPQQTLEPYNGFLKSVILRVNEARDLGDVDRFKFYDHMKAYTAAPPDVLRVNEKYLKAHYVLNCTGVIITSNHKADGIFLPADDRRHFVAWSDLTKEDFPESYWNTLWGWYEQGGFASVAAYLANLDISGFDPKAPPPKTPAFWDIVDANRVPEDAELADVLDEMEGPEGPDATTLIKITWAAGKKEIAGWLKDRKNRRLIPHRLEKCGYVPVRNDFAKDGLWKIGGARQVVYAKSALSVTARIAAANKLMGLPGIAPRKPHWP